MKSSGGVPTLTAKKMRCKVCDGVFYEFDEQIHEARWIGTETTDFRLANCPNCDTQITNETVETLDSKDAYIELDSLTGEVKAYGGFIAR